MKNILIIGRSSYIGKKFEEWSIERGINYSITKISVRDSKWKSMSWQEFDVVLNVSGLAHMKESEENKDDYFKINRDLAIELAEKAKKDGVLHFIQFSTMSVFGVKNGMITCKTKEEPTNSYGESKLQADRAITELASEKYLVTILRPPMVYGPSCPGNYIRLSNFIRKVKVLPNIQKNRSMIYVSNLAEAIIQIIDYRLTGIYYPQNSEYVQILGLAKEITKVHHTKLLKIPNVLNWTEIISKISPQANKVFGELVYDKEMSKLYDKNNKLIDYSIINFKESVRLTENEN